MIVFVIGCAVMLALLATIGITRNRFVSQKGWVIAWTLISFSFAAFIMVSFFLADPLMIEAALGGSLGFVLSISIHVLHHTLEEMKKPGGHEH